MKRAHTTRKTGFRPAPYKVGESGLEEAEQLLASSRELLKSSQDALGQLLLDVTELDWESRDALFARVAENARAAAAVYREERTADRFALGKTEDWTVERACATIVELFRRLDHENQSAVARKILEVWNVPPASPSTADHQPSAPLQLVRPEPELDDDEG